MQWWYIGPKTPQGKYCILHLHVWYLGLELKGLRSIALALQLWCLQDITSLGHSMQLFWRVSHSPGISNSLEFLPQPGLQFPRAPSKGFLATWLFSKPWGRIHNLPALASRMLRKPASSLAVSLGEAFVLFVTQQQQLSFVEITAFFARSKWPL